MTGGTYAGAAPVQLHGVGHYDGSVLTAALSVRRLAAAREADLAQWRRHPKGLDASGGGSWSRQKHERATQTAIVLEDLKTVRLARWESVSMGQRRRPTMLAQWPEGGRQTCVILRVKQLQPRVRMLRSSSTARAQCLAAGVRK